ncbi:MAG TPA: hypothetical protein VJS12_20240 [Steroidobacteraceae bacterium]|nr:hypothetical protein [Steroidobacteraceae bacterium]
MDTRWIVFCAGALLSSTALADSEVHCEVSSSNFAWGAHYAGTVIATDGTVALFEYAFDKRSEEPELFGDSWLSPTRAELATRFNPGRRVLGNLCADRRAWLREQLAVVRTAGLSKEIDTGTRDAGTARTHCFVLEPGHDRATVVLLQQDGETERHSLSPAAPQLANWLTAVSAEARRRDAIPAKDSSCIGDLPPLNMPLYRDAVVEVRQRAMAELKATPALHCQFAQNTRAELDGEQVGNYDSALGLSVVFSDLNSTTSLGRGESFGQMYPVRIGTSVAGLTLTNVDAEKNRIEDVVTIVAYRIRGHALYPAVKHQIFLHDLGAFAVRYTGECAALPKSP